MSKLFKILGTTAIITSLLITSVNSASAAYENEDKSQKADSHESLNLENSSTLILKNEITTQSSYSDPSLSDTDGGGSVEVIYVDYYIKKQGYLTNAQLKDYVKQVKNRAAGVSIISVTTSWLAANPIIGGVLGGVGIASIFANFDSISDKAAQGYGMGWAHLYAAGDNTLSVIPVRDFSKKKIIYLKK